MKFLRLFLSSCLLVLFCVSFLEAAGSPVDLLVFASAPGEETLGCGITISKAVKDHKRVKIVFLTNADSDQNSRACRAAKVLGLAQEDVLFLSYPATRSKISPYKNTSGKALSGYNRENSVSDIKKILRENKPDKVYLPSAWDNQADRVACASFINKALNELMREGEGGWAGRILLLYYTIEPKVSSIEYGNFKEISGGLKDLKRKAWQEYEVPSEPHKNGKELQLLGLDYELFWQVPQDPKIYLAEVYKEWERVAKVMKSGGYNVNMGVVADVAADIEDPGIDLVKKERIFSDDPITVSQLVEKIAQASNSGGVIPVIKHFPGLGAAYLDTHHRLATVSSSRDHIWKKDLLPYRQLIKNSILCWVMVDHAVYPDLDENPASLSYKIQTGLLRDDLGFQGIIISDDFMQMRAIEEYALRSGLKKPYIGEIVAKAFAAGTDIAIIFPAPGQAEEAISEVIAGVKKAVKEGRLSQAQINSSIIRILKEKERIFNTPLARLANSMTLEEKICQKILIDTVEDIRILNKYPLGAIDARDHKVIEEAQKICHIPLFIAGQHEGGRVIEIKLNLNTPSPYLIGREYERTLGQRSKIKEAGQQNSGDKISVGSAGNPFDYGQIDSQTHQNVVDILCAGVDEDIKEYTQKKADKVMTSIRESPAVLSLPRGDLWSMGVKEFKDLSMAWLSRFPDNNTALYAYKIFKQAFENWQERFELSQYRLASGEFRSYNDLMIAGLTGLKSEIQQIKIKNNARPMRVLCLATHPDDEDAAALLYFKYKFNAETYILFATLGEAGENRIGAQLYEELGALRTEEAEQSAALLGVKKVYYLGEKDFGYCLDPQEALSRWGAEDALSKLVYFYRLIKPDIIITKHDLALDHCQHQALISLERDAFYLSGKHKAYPQIAEYGLSAWQPRGFYQRKLSKKTGFIWGDLVIDAGEKIPSLNRSYNDLGREAIAQHRSQNIPWFPEEKIDYDLVQASAGTGVSIAQERSESRKGETIASGIPGIKIISGINVGLVEENDNVFFVSLKTLGADLKKIDTRSLAEEDLSRLDTIILGKGADRSIVLIKDADKRILEFVANGGNLVVFFQDNAPEKYSFLPYPLSRIGSGIFDENSLVKFLAPQHPLFNLPNRVSIQDFAGWIQDRGRFLFPAASEKYVNLLSCLSPSSEYQKGGYLVSSYGKGTIIVTTLAWYRQLKAFHFGAYKNLANMISYPYTKTPF